MRYILLVALLLIANSVMAVSKVSAQYTVNSQDMVAVLEHYCGSLDPIGNCGVYESDINEAEKRASQISNIIRTKSITDQRRVTSELLTKITRAFYVAQTPREKVVLSWYYMYFSQLNQGDNVDDIFEFLFGNTTPTPSYPGREPIVITPKPVYPSYPEPIGNSSGGKIDNVWSANRYTRVNSRTNEISLISYNASMAVGIRAVTNSGRLATIDDGYRMVAVLERGNNLGNGARVFGANYTNEGNREVSFSSSISRDSSIGFYLLCKSCSNGATFNKGGTFDGRRIADSVTYDLDTNNSSSRDRDDDCYYYGGRYCDDDYDNDGEGDLEVASIEYEYSYIGRNEVEVEITTTIRNNDRYELRLDELLYDVEVDGDRLGSYDYELSHTYTECDDSNVSRYEDEDIDIEGYDECQITVTFVFDEDDVDNEDIEIEVELESRDDDSSRNNSDSIIFTIR